MLRIEDESKATSEDAVRRLEGELGIVLPTLYRQFILLHNGGRPVPSTYGLNGKGELVDFFLAVDGDESDDLRRICGVFKRRVPSDFIPVARDPFGNLLCIGVKGKHLGHVYFWDHEREGGRRMSNMTLVAQSWDEFLGMLQEMPQLPAR